jgi:hypothetical protein
MKRSSRSSASGFADTANGNPFAVAKKIQERSGSSEISESARRIEQHADGMVKTILGTADMSTAELPASVIEQIVEMLRAYRQ